MPRMVDESGQPIFANHGALALGATVPSDIPQNVISTWAPIATASMVQAVEPSSTGVGQSSTVDQEALKEMLADQKAIQAGLDSQTPRNLILAFGALILLVMLLTHPRFLARLMASMKRSTRKTTSYIDTPPNSATPLHRAPKRPVGGGDLKKGWILRGGFSTSQTNDKQIKSDPFLTPFDDYQSEPISFPPTQSPPPHIAPILDHIPFASTLLWAPFAKLPRWLASSVKLSELYLIIGYLTLNAFAMIWRSDITPTTGQKGYGYDFYRTGLVAMVQIPVAVALGVRGNIVGLCVGKGYEKLKRLHKIVGQVLFVGATLHTMFYLHKYAVNRVVGKMLSKPFVLAGLLSWVAIVLIAVTALPRVKDKFYGVFKVCHIAGMMLLLVGMCFHVTVAIPWCLSALVIYAISIACSLLKTRLAHAELVALPGSSTTVITIPALKSGWRAGQHVRIRIPALGLPSGLEAHPLTIASAPDGQGMVLMCKAAGDWTDKLFDLANDPALATNDDKLGRRVMATVVLEGPHGGLGNTLLPSFSGVVLTAGGSGITQALALAHDLVTRAPSGVIRARTIDLVWAVKTEDAARPMMPTLIDMVEDARVFEEKCLEGRKLQYDLPPPVALRVHIHVTRCPASSPLTLLDRVEGAVIFDPFTDPSEKSHPGLGRQPSLAEKEKLAYTSLQTVPSPTGSTSSSVRNGYYTALSSIRVDRRRPNFGIYIEEAIEQIIDRSKRERVQTNGICVTACGPFTMVNAVRDDVREISGKKRRAVGGIELEEEQFGY